jgi:hypothetical protein
MRFGTAPEMRYASGPAAVAAANSQRQPDRQPMPSASRMPFAVLLLLSMLATVPAGALAAQNCLKLVFDRYCLGGDFSDQLRRDPPMQQQNDGERQAAVYWDAGGRTYVLSFHGRIYKVVQESHPSSPLHFQDMTALLSEKYGTPKDRSRYPAYVDSRAARIVAIRRGEGRARRVWNPGHGWLVELTWTRELGVALSYLDEQLDRKQRQAMEKDL